jgi:hypothetical protein
VIRKGTRHVANRAATALRLAATTLLRSQTYLGAPYGRLRENGESGRDALRAFDSRPPDLLVTDLGLPCMDGYDVLREVSPRASPSPRGHVVRRRRGHGLRTSGRSDGVARRWLQRPHRETNRPPGRSSARSWRS